jgi:hypothetical protein
MGKSTKKETKTKLEQVEGLVCSVDNECKGKMLPAGTVIFVGESRDGMSIEDVNKAIARGNVEARMAEVSFEDTDKKSDEIEKSKDNRGSE